MNGMMKRKKAAEYLGVTPQTITNWCNSGLLGHCYGEHKMLYVNAEDVRNYAKKYKMMAASEEMLDNRLKELKEARHKLDEETTSLRNVILHVPLRTATSEDVTELVYHLYVNLLAPEIKQREMDIMRRFLVYGQKMGDIADYYLLSPDRIRQIICKVCKKVVQSLDNMKSRVKNNDTLQDIIERQNEEIGRLKATLDKYECSHIHKRLKEFLKKPLSDFRFSNRTLNSLFYVEPRLINVLDLLTNETGKGSLFKRRGFGQKAFLEIDVFMEEYSLFFKEVNESMEEFFARLEKYWN